MHIQIRNEIEDVKPLLLYEKITVENDTDMTNAAQALRQVKDRLIAIKAFHAEVTGPIKRGIKAFEDRLRAPRTILEGLEAILKQRMEAYWDREREKILLAEQNKRRAEIQAARGLAVEQIYAAMATGSTIALEAASRFEKIADKLEAAPLTVSQTVRTGGAIVAERRVWQWRVIELDAVPRGYLVIDSELMNTYAKNYNKNPIKIPGVEFKEVSKAAIITAK